MRKIIFYNKKPLGGMSDTPVIGRVLISQLDWRPSFLQSFAFAEGLCYVGHDGLILLTRYVDISSRQKGVVLYLLNTNERTVTCSNPIPNFPEKVELLHNGKARLTFKRENNFLFFFGTKTEVAQVNIPLDPWLGIQKNAVEFFNSRVPDLSGFDCFSEVRFHRNTWAPKQIEGYLFFDYFYERSPDHNKIWISKICSEIGTKNPKFLIILIDFEAQKIYETELLTGYPIRAETPSAQKIFLEYYDGVKNTTAELNLSEI